MGNIAQHTCHRCQNVGNTNENGRFEAFLFTGHVPILKPCGPQLGPKLLPNGFNLGPSCGMLDPSWGQVGVKWVRLGPSWGLVGQWWPQVEPMLRTCGVETVHLEDVGRSAKCANCHSPVRGICSYPSLLNDQALAPSVRADFLEHSLYMHVSSFIYIYVCFKICILYLYNFTYYQISAFYIYHPDSFPAARMHHTHTHLKIHEKGMLLRRQCKNIRLSMSPVQSWAFTCQILSTSIPLRKFHKCNDCYQLD